MEMNIVNYNSVVERMRNEEACKSTVELNALKALPKGARWVRQDEVDKIIDFYSNKGLLERTLVTRYSNAIIYKLLLGDRNPLIIVRKIA